MGYDLQIIKLSDNSDGTSIPISEEQWKEAVNTDNGLKLDAVATSTNPKTKEVVQVNNSLMASWHDPITGEKTYFYYSRGKINVKNPSDITIKKMKELASKLGAKVQGEEGEFY